MNTQKAYNLWASQYDTNKNRTRDMEANVLRSVLAELPFDSCLEIGCGTGKNTEWLVQKASRITAVDLSEQMLAKAKEKVNSPQVKFMQADITEPWTFTEAPYDLVTFSLVLEHIRDLDPVLDKASHALHPGGYVYIGELHPFKQYSGVKARFDTAEGRQEVECFDHHISDFIHAAAKHGLSLVQLEEYFDDDDRTGIPRIVMLLLKKA